MGYYKIMTSKSNITRTLYSYKIHHVLFWVCYYIFWVLLYANLYSYYSSHLSVLLAVTAVYLVFPALAFYITAYWFVPRFLNHQKVFQFIILTILLVLICGFAINGGFLH